MKRGRLKGNNKSSSYNSIHLWLKYHFGNGLFCNKCNQLGIKTGRRWSLEYALKPNREHARRRENYDILCKSCHRKQDYAFSERMKENWSNGHIKRKLKGLEVPRDPKTGRLIKHGNN